MPIQDIKAAKNTLNEESETLEDYFQGLNEVKYLYDFLLLYRQSKKAVLTWTEGRWFFSYIERQNKFRTAYRDFTHFTIYSHTIIEYLSSQIIQLNIDPDKNEDVLEEIVSDLGQYSREVRLKQLGVLESGDLENNLNRIRGLRNDFAHNMRAQFEIDRRGHPADKIEKVWETISDLCELAYDTNIEEITTYLERCYVESPSSSIKDLPTAKLVDNYQYNKEENQNLDRFEEEFERRGFNPERAPDYDTIEHVESLDHLWIGGGSGTAGFSLVQVLEYNIPNFVIKDEKADFSITFQFRENPKIFEIPYEEETPSLDDLEYYAILLIDDELYDVFPATVSGRAEWREVETEVNEEANFSTRIHKEGTYSVKFGIYVKSEENPIEWIQDPAASGEIYVQGP